MKVQQRQTFGCGAAYTFMDDGERQHTMLDKAADAAWAAYEKWVGAEPEQASQVECASSADVAATARTAHHCAA